MKTINLPLDSALRDRSFLFGTATSSFQIEGAADSRLKSIWDTFCEQEGKIADKSDGLIACEHVARFKEDVDLLQEMGVDAYRFSISWPRVIQQNGELNPQGVQFYIDLLDELASRGIQAFATLYHWDLPQYLEDLGGWLNRDTAYAFQQYVEKITQALGTRVQAYATFNEPFCSAYLGYEIGVHAPGKTGRKQGRTAAHHILLAHGLGMQALREHAPHAKNGIVLNFTPCYPVSETPADQLATIYADEYINQWYMQPVMEGSYPPVLEKLAPEDKPDIQPGDMEIICQPLDFLGVNFYTRLTYSAAETKGELYTEHAHREPKTDIGWEIYPQAFYDLLTSLNARYDLPPIYITENGAAMADKLVNGEVADNDRIDYYEAHLCALSDAIDAGVNVAGYFAWSLMDNFEWAEGYVKRFGLVYVDFETQTRLFKHSAHAYKLLLAQRS